MFQQALFQKFPTLLDVFGLIQDHEMTGLTEESPNH